MPRRSFRLAAPADELTAEFASIRDEIGIATVFPPEALAEAEEAARSPRIPDTDLTDLPFVTLDPPGSMDLDQAFHLERRAGGGFRLRYAIADVAAWVTPGGEVDLEAHRRVETAYSPDGRSPLYPPVLSEAAASLLPDGPRPAALWQIDVDASGAILRADVGRALVSSRAQLAYPAVQAELDAGTAGPMLEVLPEVGGVLEEAERARGGASLGVPSQEVVHGEEGFALSFVDQLPVERWNAQLSLLTGRVAADIMLRGGAGILRTMSPADERDVARLRRIASGLAIPWGADVPYAQMLHTIDPRRSDAEAAFLQEAAVLFRAASYASFDGHPPPDPLHAAIAAPYTHCTAPLRRLVDRYAAEVCVALASGGEVPTWARRALPRLPEEMATGADKANRLERTIVDAVEAAVLAPFVGDEFDGLVVDLWKRGRGEVAIRDPAVVGPCEDVSVLGAAVRVRLEEASLHRRSIRFSARPVY